MFNFLDFLNQYSGIGLQNGMGVEMFQDSFPGSPFMATNGDPHLQQISETAFNINQFIGRGGRTDQDIADYEAGLAEINERIDAVDTSQYDPYDYENGGDPWERELNELYDERDTYKERRGFNLSSTQSAQLQDLAPVIGSLAGLQELNSMEGSEQAKQQKLNFQNPNLYRVNPTNGLSNFNAKNGGNMHDTKQMKKLPSNFTIPRINLSGTDLDVGDDVQLFHNGGSVGYTPNYRDKVGNYNEGIKDRYFEGSNRVPIQTESGGKGKEEMIILPSFDLISVNALKRHKRMDPNEVTDYVPEGSYILSQFGDININREEADNLTTEIGVDPYDVFGTNGIPTRKSLADVMTKKEMSPADVARAIKKKFKQVDREDPFTRKTNEENRVNSAPYLQGLVLLSEVDKQRKGIESEIDKAYNPGSGATYLPPEPSIDLPTLPNFASGGIVKKNVLKAPIPALLAAALPSIIGLVGTGISAIAGNKAANKAQAAIDEQQRVGQQKIDENEARQVQNNQFGTGVSLISLMAQDTTVEAPQLDDSGFRRFQTGIPQAQIDSQISRLFNNNNSNNTFSAAPSFAQGLAGQSLLNTQTTNAANNLFVQDALQRVGLTNQKELGRQDLKNRQIVLNNQAEAGQRTANNNRIGGIGSAAAGYFNTDSNIAGNSTTATLANLGQQVGGTLQVNAQRAQNIGNVLSGVQQFAPQLFTALNPPAQSQPIDLGDNSFANGTREFNLTTPGPGNCPPGKSWNGYYCA